MNLELKLPPLVVVLLAVLLMLLLDRIVPALDFALARAPLLAAVLVLAGALPVLLGVFAFRRAETTVDPRYPQRAAQLVSTGIYAVTRNPMYLGMVIGLAGWAVFLRNWSCFAVLPLFMLYLSRFQIQPEERHMRDLFGDAFDDYRRRVRRWL